MKHYYYSIISCLLFLQLSFSALAHTVISGKIVNAKSKEPLSGANVVIQGTSEGTITDVFGNFYLETEEINVVLTISFVGFETLEFVLENNTTNLVIGLSAKPFKLEEVTVSATNVRDMQSLNKISKIDIETRPIRTSQDILRIVPGLFMAQHAGGGKAEQIFLRGFDTDHGTDINIC